MYEYARSCICLDACCVRGHHAVYIMPQHLTNAATASKNKLSVSSRHSLQPQKSNSFMKQRVTWAPRCFMKYSQIRAIPTLRCLPPLHRTPIMMSQRLNSQCRRSGVMRALAWSTRDGNLACLVSSSTSLPLLPSALYKW